MSASHVPLIDLTGICRSYRSGDVVTHALRGVGLSIYSGEFVAIVGASGSGKSTLMNIIGLTGSPPLRDKESVKHIWSCIPGCECHSKRVRHGNRYREVVQRVEGLY